MDTNKHKMQIIGFENKCTYQGLGINFEGGGGGGNQRVGGGVELDQNK